MLALLFALGPILNISRNGYGFDLPQKSGRNKERQGSVKRQTRIILFTWQRMYSTDIFLYREITRSGSSDTTYMWTEEGWLYLAVIVDLFSRTVVGWATSIFHDKGLVLSALKQTVLKRQPHPGLLHHSDRWSQYASHEYQQLLGLFQILGSMSRKGDCLDNAVAESFFATLKGELIDSTQWSSRVQIRNALFDYIEIFYNRKRRHSSLDYLSPLEYEHKNLEVSGFTSN